ncbi:sugar phosphate isomerase/epimerase family protein [Halioxenophilus sp. WMMB6]|uniref:sugar phosphate isomerase/epimerase family protein n=1 Tax=Halioxenophilus sp. WMMB6 TaxID=3073815 RepID=UPI00295E7358|nr:TIM barrel protein [Halioxenophilus sp. WMMB6]
MHPRISVNSVNVMNASLDEQVYYWRRLAAHRVSLISPQLDNYGVAKMAECLAQSHCSVETIVHNFFTGPLTAEPTAWQAAQAKLRERIDQAQALGAQSIYMMTGGHGDLTWEAAAEIFCTAIQPCLAYAQAAGVRLMIENAPAQYADLHIAHTLKDTVWLAERADIGVCIDLFFCWAEPDLQATFVRALPRCGLVQVSDYVLGDRNLPARAVPGDGTIPLARLIGWLISVGYQGNFDLELIGPRIDDEDPQPATERAANVLGKILDSHALHQM